MRWLMVVALALPLTAQSGGISPASTRCVSARKVSIPVPESSRGRRSAEQPPHGTRPIVTFVTNTTSSDTIDFAPLRSELNLYGRFRGWSHRLS